jgi:hypothetical protein
LASDTEQTRLRLESLGREYKKLREEIEDLQRELEAKLERGEDAWALIELQGENLDRANEILSEFLSLIDESLGKD